MSYELAEVSGNLGEHETWDRLAKFIVAHVVVGMIMALIIMSVMPMMVEISEMLGIIFLIGVILVGNAFMLSWYEKWRGCHFKTE